MPAVDIVDQPSTMHAGKVGSFGEAGQVAFAIAQQMEAQKQASEQERKQVRELKPPAGTGRTPDDIAVLLSIALG